MSKSIRNNYLYSIFYQVLTFIVPFATIPYLSRVFGPEGMGEYSYTSSVAQYFLLFAMLGLNNYGVRAIAMVRDNEKELGKTFSEIYTMQFLTSLLVIIVYMLFVYIFGCEYKSYYLILVVYVASSLFDINWYFFGVEKFKITVVRNSIIKLMSVILIFLFIKNNKDLWIYLLIHSLSTLISSMILWPTVLKSIKYSLPPINDIVKHIKPNLSLFIPVIAVSVYKYMDKIMLGNFSVTEAGYYENVEKILTVILGLITAFGTVMLPRISNLVAKRNEEAVQAYLVRSMDFVLFLSIGMVCGLWAVSTDFVPLFLGKEFTPSIVVLEFLSISALFSSWANVIRTQYLIPYKKDKIYVISVIVGATLNFCFNYAMIPKLGAMGAVYGTIVAEFVVAFVQTIFAAKLIPCKKMIFSGIPYLIFGISMCCMLSYLKVIDNVYVRLVASVVVGLIYYSLCGVITYKIKNGSLVVKI